MLAANLEKADRLSKRSIRGVAHELSSSFVVADHNCDHDWLGLASISEDRIPLGRSITDLG